MTETYRALFDKSSHHLEKIGASALEVNVLKGASTLEKAVGKFIGSIPLIKEGFVDEFLRNNGAQLKEKAIGTENKAVHRFSSLSNPGTYVFMEIMEDMSRIFNHTEQICFDDKKIYLVAGYNSIN